MEAYACDVVDAVFDPAWDAFTEIIGWVGKVHEAGLTHAQVEDRLFADMRALGRRLFQAGLDVQAEQERRLQDVADADGVGRGSVEGGHERALATRFGEVVVRRMAYRRRGLPNLHPADAVLNLPAEKHSHGVRRMAAGHATRGSFAVAATALTEATGLPMGKRQVQELTVRAAVDVEAFYTAHASKPAPATDILALSFDAKGVVMHPRALREPTAKAAASRKLTGRLSRGEKRCRKRMAEVAAVYDAAPALRRPVDVLPDPDRRAPRRPGPKATGKWLTASVTDDAAAVIAAGFAEAERRDPEHHRTWVALVDGNSHQIDRIQAEAHHRTVEVTIVVDFIHVAEYVWKAAWCFFTEGDRRAETWVHAQLDKILQGKAGTVAGAIRRKATYHGLDPGKRAGADACATYLLNKKPYLDYPTALAAGWPIATGVIEGACRHLVKDRMDLTGARWGLQTAEAVLRLRAVITNGDLDAYWAFHLAQEQQRVHNTRYKDGVIPTR